MKSKTIFLLITLSILIAACGPKATPTPAPVATVLPTTNPTNTPAPTLEPAAPTPTQISLNPADWGMQEIDAPAFSPAKGSIHYSLPQDVAQELISNVMAEGHLKYDPGQKDSRTNPEIYNQVFSLLYPASPAEQSWREHVDKALAGTAYTINKAAPIQDSNYFTDWMTWAVDGGPDLGLLIMVHHIEQPQTITYYDKDGNIVKQNMPVKPLRVVTIYRQVPDGEWLKWDEEASFIEP
jgi:hypothetical protein